MRSLFFVLSALSVMGLAFWAYRENYRTQNALRDMARLQNEIGSLREALSVQRAEWAYLNRPERLAELADLNFERLSLLPLDPSQFGDVATLPYPPAPRPLLPEAAGPDAAAGQAITDPVELSGTQEVTP